MKETEETTETTVSAVIARVAEATETTAAENTDAEIAVSAEEEIPLPVSPDLRRAVSERSSATV